MYEKLTKEVSNMETFQRETDIFKYINDVITKIHNHLKCSISLTTHYPYYIQTFNV